MSGFGLHSVARLASADGKFYQAWLWQKGGNDEENAVRLSSDNPITISWGRAGSDIYVPVLAAHAALNGLKVTSEFGDLVGAKADQWRLEIVRGDSHDDIDGDSGTRIFLGRVLSDVYEDSTMGDVHILNLQAVDGLGALQEIPYYDTTTSAGERLAYEGRESLLTILIRALGKLGYDLPIRSAIAWRPTTVSSGEDTLAEVDVDNLAFYSADGQAMSCYAVVEEICRRLGARLCQWEGAWWIVSRELQTGTAYTYFKYDSSGTADGTDTAGAGIDTSADGVTKTAGKRTFRPAYTSVGVLQNHGAIPPLIDEGDFTVDEEAGRYIEYGRFWTTVRPKFVPNAWSYEGNAKAREAEPSLTLSFSNATGRIRPVFSHTPLAQRNFVHSVPSYFHGTDTNPAAVKAKIVAGSLQTTGPHYAERLSDTVEKDAFVNFNGKVLIEHNDGAGLGLFTPYWSLVIDGTNHYLKRDGTWGESADENDQVQFLIPPAPGQRFGEFGIALENEINFSITSAELPAEGKLRLRLYGTSDKNGQDLDPGDTLWDDVAVLIVDKAGESFTARRTEVFIVDSAEPPREDIEVLTGEAVGVIIPRTLTDAGTKTSNWTSARLGTARDLGVIHAETVLRSQASPLEVRQESYEGLAGSPIAPFKIGDDYFPVQQLTLSLYHQISSGEWCKLLWDSSVTTESAEGPVGPGTGGQLHGGGSSGGVAGGAIPTEAIPGGTSIRHGLATVTGTSGDGGVATVHPPLVSGEALTIDRIQLTPHTNAKEVHFGLENVTDTSFDIRAVTSDGSDVTFTWWVLEGGVAALLGEWHFDEARNSHHILTAGF